MIVFIRVRKQGLRERGHMLRTCQSQAERGVSLFPALPLQEQFPNTKICKMLSLELHDETSLTKVY